jgi:hypothetical protein
LPDFIRVAKVPDMPVVLFRRQWMANAAPKLLPRIFLENNFELGGAISNRGKSEIENLRTLSSPEFATAD